MEVVSRVNTYDESQALFDKKKAKEKLKFDQRNAQDAWSPKKIEKNKPTKIFQEVVRGASKNVVKAKSGALIPTYKKKNAFSNGYEYP